MWAEWPLPPQSRMKGSMQVWWHVWINVSERTWEHNAEAIVSVLRKRDTRTQGHKAIIYKHVSVQFEMINAWMWYQYLFVMIRLMMINLQAMINRVAWVSCVVIGCAVFGQATRQHVVDMLVSIPWWRAFS